jgi:hypothetical protein
VRQKSERALLRRRSGETFKTCPWKESCVPSGRDHEESMTCSREKYLPFSFYWDGSRSLSLPWWSIPRIRFFFCQETGAL